MADRSVRVRFIADVGSYREGVRQAGQATAQFGREMAGMGSATREQMETVGRSALVMSAGLAAGLTLSARAAISWESAWAGVMKVIEGSPDELARLEGQLRDLATQLPATHTEIAATAQAAGQLGIARDDIAEFTRVMIALGETTNLSATDAATSLARMSNIMGTSMVDIERLGSVVVDLGNNSATTEAEIVELATRLAAAGRIAGMTEADVLAFAATLTSVGVEAQAGGTALSKVFVSIRDAVLTGSDSLEVFARTAGVSAAEFRRAFQADAATAVAMFIEGLGRINAAGQSTTAIFQELQLTDQRLMRALLSTASAQDLLRDSLERGNRAWEENIALANEAALRYGTTESKMQVLRNQFNDLAIEAGQVLLPALEATAAVLSHLVTGFSELPGPVMAAGVGLAAVSVAGLAVVAALGIMAPKVIAARAALMGMGTGGQFVARNMGTMANAAGIAGIAMVGLSMVMAENARQAQESRDRLLGYANAIREAGDAATGTANRLATMLTDSPELAEWLADAEVSVDRLAAAIHGTDAEWELIRSHLMAVAESTGLSGLALEAYGIALNRMRGEARDAVDHVDNSAQAIGRSGAAAAGASDDIDDYRQAMEQAAREAEVLERRLRALSTIANAPLDRRSAILDLADAQDRVRDAQDALSQAQKRGADASHSVESAHRRLADAKRNVTDRQVELTKAEEAYALILSGYGDDHEKSIDAKHAAAQAARDAERAVLALADAEKRLRDPRLSGGDRRKAELDVADARERVRQTAIRAEEAERKYQETAHGASATSEQAKKAAEEVEQAERRLEDARQSEADAARALQKAETDRTNALATNAGTLRTRERLERDLERALIDLERATISAAEKEAEHEIAAREVAGAVVEAQEAHDILVEKLDEMAGRLDPGSPLRKNLEDYADILRELPELSDAVRTPRPGDPNFVGPVDPRMVPGDPRFVGPVLPSNRRAMGGRVNPDEMYWVGENGPEPFIPDRPGVVLSPSQTTNVMKGSSTTYAPNVTMHVVANNQPTEQAALEAMRREAWERYGILG